MVRRNNRHISEIATPASGHAWPEGRLVGRSKISNAAVVAQVIVAVPVGATALNEMEFGAVKFESGAPKEQVGKSAAPDGEAVTAELRVTVPTKPVVPVAVTSCVTDRPGCVTLSVTVPDVGARLMPGEPTLTVIADDIEPAM